MPIAQAIFGQRSAENAADAQVAAAQKGSDTILQMFNQTRADQAPWRQAGGEALGALAQFYGLPGLGSSMSAPGANGISANPSGSGGYQPTPGGGLQRTATTGPSAPGAAPAQQPYDFNSILQNLPGYQFQLQQGQQAAQRDLASRGLLNSGAALKSLTQYGQGLASNYADKYASGLSGLAGLGQYANQSTAAAGSNAANTISGNTIYAGNASAAGFANQYNNFASMMPNWGKFASFLGGG